MIRRIGSIVVASIAFCQLAFAQETPKAILVDETSSGTICEEALARLDNFHVQLANNPDSIGFGVIHPERDLPKRGEWYRKLVVISMFHRKVGQDQLKIIKGQEKERLGLEFWLLPSGADKPPQFNEEWPERTYPREKPFIYDTSDDEGVCPTFVPEHYAAYLKANPNVRGHIAIFLSENGRETAKRWLRIFTYNHKIPPKRLWVFFGKRSNFPYEEFWIVPKKRR